MSSITPAKRSRSDRNPRAREAEVTLDNVVSNYGGTSDEPGLVLSHKKPMPSTAFLLDNARLTAIMCPMVTIRKTLASKYYTWDANQELLLEMVTMHYSNFLELKTKSFHNAARYWALLSNPSTLDMSNLDFRFQGGRYKYTFYNSCNQVIFLEIREFKNKKHDMGKSTSESPYRLWRIDCANNQTTGDLPYGTTQLAPDNTTSLGELPQGTPISYGVNEYVANESKCAVGFRPHARSPLLRTNYDVGEKVMVKLCPGQSFEYYQVIHPFYCSRNADTYSNTYNTNGANEIQWYTRFLHVFAKGAWNTSSAVGQGANMAPGPGGLHIVREQVENIRSIPGSRPSVAVDFSANAGLGYLGGYGPFTDIVSTNAQHENPTGTAATGEVPFDT